MWSKSQKPRGAQVILRRNFQTLEVSPADEERKHSNRTYWKSQSVRNPFKNDGMTRGRTDHHMVNKGGKCWTEIVLQRTKERLKAKSVGVFPRQGELEDERTSREEGIRRQSMGAHRKRGGGENTQPDRSQSSPKLAIE